MNYVIHHIFYQSGVSDYVPAHLFGIDWSKYRFQTRFMLEIRRNPAAGWHGQIWSSVDAGYLEKSGPASGAAAPE
ncbi:hypothetical protein [Alkalicoccus urumqiensis]|uniref:Uncharacterized protein n=1 Tax=Alkalicoccus urumqiensis TaxID=1548213 RepID=A0A2P6MJP6_ALKUR|nr:hypothetical protein [Alkalicoccus urumqiensis]PRO66508.1 hypothetical protein C6I21_03975 [Alkalicoccus urumqiensis]